MSFKIGFTAETESPKAEPVVAIAPRAAETPRRSVVQVHFPSRGTQYAYYNDRFDLHVGDLVFVTGKLEGIRGRVVEVSYSFKIKVKDYQTVIGKAITDVHGEFHATGSHLMTFDPEALPYDTVRSWLLPPVDPEEVFVSSEGDEEIPIEDLSGWKVRGEVMERGQDYYLRNNVVYLCLDGTRGRAIVDGSEEYEVEFTYQNGMVGNLACSCYCSGACKHGVATVLQLRETLRAATEEHKEAFEKTAYVAAISKPVFFTFAVNNKSNGTLRVSN